MAIPPSSIDSQSGLARWLLGWLAEAFDDEKAPMIQAAYGLWLARNEARDIKKIAPPHEIIETVVTYTMSGRLHMRARHAWRYISPSKNGDLPRMVG